MARQGALRFGALHAVILLSISCLCHGGGFPVCPPSFLSCGDSGCYSSILTRCVAGQCRGLFGSLLPFATAAGPCPVKYLNTCGDAYCGIEDACVEGSCVPITASNSSQPLTSTLAAAAGVTADMSAIDTCRAARKAFEACANDTSQLSVVDCNSIGVGSVPGVTCLQSRLFNCATAPGLAPYYTCRALAVLGDAVGEVMGDRLQNVSQPVLLPVFEDIANWVGNMSQNVLNVTLPATEGISTTISALLNSGKTNSSSGFVLVPPDGISGVDSNRRLSSTLLVGILALHLYVWMMS